MGNVVKKRTMESLPCSLTAEEFVDRATQLGQVDADVRALEGRTESMRQQLKAELAELEAKRTRLSAIVTRKEEVRQVEVEVQLDYDRGQTVRVRMDTGEVIQTRPMNDDERQRKLEVGQPA